MVLWGKGKLFFSSNQESISTLRGLWYKYKRGREGRRVVSITKKRPGRGFKREKKDTRETLRSIGRGGERRGGRWGSCGKKNGKIQLKGVIFATGKG